MNLKIFIQVFVFLFLRVDHFAHEVHVTLLFSYTSFQVSSLINVLSCRYFPK